MILLVMAIIPLVVAAVMALIARVVVSSAAIIMAMFPARAIGIIIVVFTVVLAGLSRDNTSTEGC